jgi:hypothetical protein
MKRNKKITDYFTFKPQLSKSINEPEAEIMAEGSE